MVYIFNMVLPMYSLKDGFVYPYLAYRDSVFHDISDSLFIVRSHVLTRWQTSEFGPSGVITTYIFHFLFGLCHVAVVLSFLRSQISLAVIYEIDTHFWRSLQVYPTI